jgi:hypothetical protein
MKRLVENYTYNKTTGVITLTGVNIDRDQLLLIVNTTRNVTYYNLADSATTLQAFTQGANTSLTLNSSVITASSAHANGDALIIYYDDQASTVKVDGLNTAEAFGKGVIQPITDAEQDTIRSSLWIPVSSAPNGTAGEGQILSQSYPMPIIGTVTANLGLNELPYIKININVTNTNTDTIVANVFLRRIGEYSYESLRYQGGEDEAYFKVYLDAGGESVIRRWRISALGAYTDLNGFIAYNFAPSTNSNFGNALPPKDGWMLETGITGTLSISYEQPSTQIISGTVTASDSGWVLLGTRDWSDDNTPWDITGLNEYSSIRLENNGGGGSEIEAFAYGNYANDMCWTWDGDTRAAFNRTLGFTDGKPYTAPVQYDGIRFSLQFDNANDPCISKLYGKKNFTNLGLTNQQLRENPVSVTATDLGAKADAVATTDTGTFSVISLIKRGLQNWTSLLAKIPTLVSGRIPVDGSGVTQPISDKGSTGESNVTSFTSTSSAVLKASNSNRKLLTIFNEGNGTLFILLGSGTASTSNYSLRLLGGDYYELEKYTGELNAIFASSGTAKVTEIT